MSKEQLIDSASKARTHCYCPYSSFPVSAALMASSGEIYIGVNVENASFGLTLCAERVALTSAIAAGERSFEEIVIMTKGGGSPCGACRQVLNEFAPNLLVSLVNEQGEILSEVALDKLLPNAFGPHSL